MNITEKQIEVARLTYAVKIKEYNSDFERSDKPSDFWETKYGTNLHATYLGEQWAMRAALEAAFAPSPETNVAPLEWIEEEPNWWSAQPSVMINRCGYEVRVTGRGLTRIRRGSEDWNYFEGSAEDAKAFWQKDFEDRMMSALRPGLNNPWTDDDRARVWREAMDEQHQRAMRAEAVIRDNWQGDYWRAVNHKQADEVRAVLGPRTKDSNND